MEGWVKIHRRLLDWGWYSDHNVCRLFVHLLLTVNCKDSEWRGVSIKRGQRVFGREKLAEETGLSVQELRTASTKLKSTGEITIKSTSKFSILTICNFDKYQGREGYDQPEEQPAGQPTINQQSTTSKEGKKERSTSLRKSAGDSTHFAEFWTAYPRKKNKVDAQKAWQQVKGDSIFEEIVAGLQRAIASSDWTKAGGQYIPYPASWLRAGGWMDEIGTNATATCQTCRHHGDQCQGKDETCSAYEVTA